jgi:hypothetical protein
VGRSWDVSEPLRHTDDLDALVEVFRTTELRLRQALFGDGIYSGGLVKGEERRAQVTRDLGRMRDSFTALREHDEAHAREAEGRVAEAEARIAELEETLRSIASSSRPPVRKSA